MLQNLNGHFAFKSIMSNNTKFIKDQEATRSFKIFSKVPRAISQNAELSGLARGLYTLLFSHHSSYNISKKEIHRLFFPKDSYKSLMRAWKELVEDGFIEERRLRSANGKYNGWEYTLRSVPEKYRKRTEDMLTEQIDSIPLSPFLHENL
jgi:hypothetical protein